MGLFPKAALSVFSNVMKSVSIDVCAETCRCEMNGVAIHIASTKNLNALNSFRLSNGSLTGMSPQNLAEIFM
jgi:hypothetical protein